MKRKWDARTKARIVLEGLMGGCVNEICRNHELRPGLYYKWTYYRRGGKFTYISHFTVNEPAHKEFEAGYDESEPSLRVVFETDGWQVVCHRLL